MADRIGRQTPILFFFKAQEGPKWFSSFFISQGGKNEKEDD